MSQGMKILVGFVVAALLLGGLSVAGVIWVGRGAIGAMAPDLDLAPAAVNTVAHEIVDLELPSVYTPQFAAEMAGFKVASYTAGDPSYHLYLAEAPDYVLLEPAIVENQFGASVGIDRHNRERMRMVESRDLTVRGQPAALSIREGVNAAHQPYRELTVLFTGKGGQSLLSISAPIAQWDVMAAATVLAQLP